MRRTCPLCRSAAARPVPRYASHHLARCRDCGLVFAARIPTPAELDAFYADYPLHPELGPITRLRYQELLRGFQAERSTGRLLDAGCGQGFFLDEAMAMGWAAHGSEYDRRVVEGCRARGIEMWTGPLDATSFPEGHFDVITSFEVLEHLGDPLAELHNFHRMLRPGGVLYITTPNFGGIGRRLARGRWNVVNYPEHLNYFTPRTLAHALARAGLHVERSRTTGVSVSRLRGGSGAPGGGEANTDPKNSDQRLRARIEGSAALRLAKRTVNGLLSTFALGDSIKFTARRPQ